MNKFLQRLLYILLLALPIIDSIYNFKNGASSPAIIIRAVVVLLMFFLLIRMNPLGQSQRHAVRTVIILLAYIVGVSICFTPRKEVLYDLIRLSYSFWGFILFYYLAKKAYVDEKSFMYFYLFLIIVVAVCLYMNVGQRMGTVKELNEADNTGYALLCTFAGVMLLTKRKIFPLAIFLVVVGTLISGKRGAVVGLALSSIPLVRFIFTTYSRGLAKKFVFFILAVVAVIVAMRFFGNLFDATFNRIENIVEDGGSGRDELYLGYWNHFASSDFIHQLFGHGLFAGAYLSGSRYAFTLFLAHNEWLELLFDYGIVGVFLYLLVILKIVMVILQNRKNKNIYYYMLLMSFIIWLTKSIVSSTFIMDVNSIYLYMTTAYAMAKLEASTQNRVLPQSAFQAHL